MVLCLTLARKNDGGQSGVRTLDHRDVSQFYGEMTQTEAMNRFIEDTSSVRVGITEDSAVVDLIKSTEISQKTKDETHTNVG